MGLCVACMTSDVASAAILCGAMCGVYDQGHRLNHSIMTCIMSDADTSAKLHMQCV